MSYSYAATRTATTTMTEARVRAVMRKVAANFRAFVTAGLVTESSATKWSDDLIFLQLEEVLDYFEVQVVTPAGNKFGLRYTVSADGSIYEDSRSGGLDVYGIPPNSTVKLFAKMLPGKLASVRDELEKRGWSFNGSSLEGEVTASRAFSSNGYGINRSQIGAWP